MKKCTRCLKNLEDSNFNERAPGYLYRQCKECKSEVRKERFKNHPESKIKAMERSKKWYEENKEKALKRSKENHKKNTEKAKWHRLWYTHRLSKATYMSVLDVQNGVCAICKEDKRLYVDHDHSCCNSEMSCGQCIRGLICQKCNLFMHYVDRYMEYMDTAVEYAGSRIKNPDRRN